MGWGQRGGVMCNDDTSGDRRCDKHPSVIPWSGENISKIHVPRVEGNTDYCGDGDDSSE